MNLFIVNHFVSRDKLFDQLVIKETKPVDTQKIKYDNIIFGIDVLLIVKSILMLLLSYFESF